ncbi:MAG: aminoacyl-histidine dipeptidase [Ignavibacteriaceae bacterium]|nr:aminoacyl-histidine dipeptidase [Ignavibacteriaceae bacterium]
MSIKAIEGLQPKILWNRFYEITQVPRPSKKEEKILYYLKQWSEKNKFHFKQDKTGNLVVSIPASKGMEDCPIIVLQGHVDMVCEKNKGTNHNFDTDPLKLKRDNGWIRAEGTTLGSDNGIGVAAGLAVAEDINAEHGPLELLFTVDEETGLTGADNLQPGFITGKYLLNLDSEEDGIFYVGCAGGIDTRGIFDIETEAAGDNTSAYELLVSGLKGGHSGSDINMGKANAIKILARTLLAMEKINYSVAQITGGLLSNAIPRESEAVVLFNHSDEKKILGIINETCSKIIEEYKTSDGDLKIILKKINGNHPNVFTKSFTKNLVNVILAMPHGVLEMSQDIPGLVETSTNLASIKTGNGKVTIGTSQRSSIDSAIHYVTQSVAAVIELGRGLAISGEGYPGWKPNLNSRIMKLSNNVYKELFGSEPEIKAIHAGLECGILGNKYPGIDMVSFGPTITGAHSPDEGVEIKSVDKFYELLKGILRKASSLGK